MSISRLLIAAAALAVITGPAMAQQVISEPGYCAFFYPNANCQNKGANNPYNGDYQLRREIRGAYAWGASPCALGAATYVGRGGRRYACH
jgi:hypothetical protein